MDIEHHTDLAEMQYRLDRYGAGCYWAQSHIHGQPRITPEHLARLKQQALHVGCSDEQLVDAHHYATQCALRGTKPLQAGPSTTAFLPPTHHQN